MIAGNNGSIYPLEIELCKDRENLENEIRKDAEELARKLMQHARMTGSDIILFAGFAAPDSWGSFSKIQLIDGNIDNSSPFNARGIAFLERHADRFDPKRG